MRKIDAFTLMEVIIVMIISMIVISLTYKTLDIVSMQYRQFNKNSKQVYELSLMETLLTKDFANSEYVKRVSNGMMCGFKRKSILYTFDDSSMIRVEGAVSDTFNIVPNNVRYYFSDKNVSNINGYIDRVVFVSNLSNSKLFTYRKIYASDFLLNTQAIQDN